MRWGLPKGEWLQNNNWGISLFCSDGNTLTNNNVCSNVMGVYLGSSCRNMLTNNNAYVNTYYGIHLDWHSNYNTVTNNSINSNILDGICLDYSSNNMFTNNTVYANLHYGIYVGGELGEDSDCNKFINNNVKSNGFYGIHLEGGSTANEIYLNNFNNTRNARSFCSPNFWNSTEKICYTYNNSTYLNYLGNYWSDYTGSDANGDGIGGTHYWGSIYRDKDNYPLMEPWENYPPGEEVKPPVGFTYGGCDNDWGDSIVQTTDGGYIIAGLTQSYGAGGDDVWLIKTDSNGNKIWDKTYGGTGWDMGRSAAQTPDGGYIVVGSTQSYGIGGDAWLIKTDSNGNEIWNKTYGGTDWDEGISIAKTSDGGYTILGRTDSYGAGDDDVWLIKTDSNGNEIWNKTYGGTNWDGGSSVSQTSDGGYIIAGSTESYGNGSADVWLIKTDSNGNKIWDITYGGTNWDGGSSVVQTSDGGYIVAGHTYSYGNGSADVWLIKIGGETNQPPIANFTYSQPNPIVNQTITFNASSSYDPDGIVTGYEWSFGDGTNGIEKIVTHSYASAGDYNVILTVTDDDGAMNSTSKTITINPLRGDLNGDDQITPADAAIALQIAVGSHPCDDAMLAAADVSRDGYVTSLDALMILQAAAGAISL